MEGLIVHRKPASPEVLATRRARIAELSAAFFKVPQLDHGRSVQEIREMRVNGTHGFPKPWYYEGAKTIDAPSRGTHKVPLRIINPTNARRGFALHYHSGGFVINSASSQDPYLVDIAKRLDMMVISVDYRHAPEDVFPAPIEDCVDAAFWALSEEGEKAIDAGGPLQFITGDSAGGQAAVLVTLALRDQFEIDVRSRIKALLLNYGLFDLSQLPSNKGYTGSCLVNRKILDRFADIAFGHLPKEEFKQPHVSPIYAELSNLPPAIFTCGDEDALLDDSVLMACKWHLAGNKTELQIIPEVFHAFNLNPVSEAAIESNDKMVEFAQKFL